MRRVRFDLTDRLTLIPVEITFVMLPMLVAAAVLFLLEGPLAAAAVVAAILAGVVLFPVLLPWIPTPDFSSKGFLLGGVVAVPFAVAAVLEHSGGASWGRLGEAAVYLLAMPPVTAFTALNFTGSTTFTSWTHVKREMFAYIPRMAWSFGAGIVPLGFLLVQRLGGS
ncbi:MAG TPA: carbon monoxide dehydrogenase, partial [Chloroflexota bacterium]|nr:carbon monoxide dehydrogenase [Chloroflexota bacterium]